MSTFIEASNAISRRVIKDAKSGNYMQQQLSLLMSGDYQKDAQPLVNITLTAGREPDENLDERLLDRIIDIQPESKNSSGISKQE